MAESDADFLKSVDGLDYAAAIERMAGNFENYMKVLIVSADNIYENYKSLCALGDFSNMGKAAEHFHSLKGIFLNIGADSLAEQSKQLELAAKSYDTAYVNGHMQEYVNQVKEFDVKLSDACDLYKRRDESLEGGSIDDEEFKKCLNRMKSLIEDYEYTEIMDLLDDVMPRCDGEKKQGISKVYDLIQNFEYEEALSVLCGML